MNTPLANGWKLYRRMVVPHAASNHQVADTKKAFYAGATVLFEILSQGIGNGNEPSEADIEVMNNLGLELATFGAQFDAEYLKRAKH